MIIWRWCQHKTEAAPVIFLRGFQQWHEDGIYSLWPHPLQTGLKPTTGGALCFWWWNNPVTQTVWCGQNPASTVAASSSGISLCHLCWAEYLRGASVNVILLSRSLVSLTLALISKGFALKAVATKSSPNGVLRPRPRRRGGSSVLSP